MKVAKLSGRIKIVVATFIILMAGASAALCVMWMNDARRQESPPIGLTAAADGRYYYNESGVPQYGFQTVDGALYYFDTSTGRALSGWFTAPDGGVYYFGADNRALVGEQTIDGAPYTFGADGKLQETAAEAEFTWQVLNGRHYCLNAEGEYLVGLQRINGFLYYFDADGVRQGGWHTVDGKRYCFSEATGRAAVGWMNGEDGVYYFGEDGAMLSGQQTINGEAYTFGEDGKLQVKSQGGIAAPRIAPPAAPPTVSQQPAAPAAGVWENDRYRLPGGAYATGAQLIDGKAYLFGDDGLLKKGWVNYGGRIYHMDETTGAALTGWQQDPSAAGEYYLMGADGAALGNLQKTADGSLYYLDPITFRRLDGMQLVDGKLYYFAGTNDAAVTGWYTVDESEVPEIPAVAAAIGLRTFSASSPQEEGNRYYFCADYYALTGVKEIAGLWYGFTDEGVQIKGWHEAPEGRYYFGGGNGSAVVNDWADHTEGRVRLGADGRAQSGLFTTGGKKYYTNEKGVRMRGWITTAEGRFCFEDIDDAAIINNWRTSPAGEVYLGDDGLAYTGARKVGDVLYGFGANGVLLSGWNELGGEWYCLDAAGKALYGWQPRGESESYIGADGFALKGRQPIPGEGTFYFNTETAVREGGLKTLAEGIFLFGGPRQSALTGPVLYEGKNYLFGGDGAAYKGVQLYGGEHYYYDGNGVRAVGWQNDGTYKYYFDPATAKAAKGWFTDAADEVIYYFDTTTSRALTGPQTIDKREYVFDGNGRLAPSGNPDENWVTAGGKTYYLGEDGQYVKGFVPIGAAYYYFDANGAQVTGWKTHENKRYYFDADNKGKAAAGWFTDEDDGGKRYYFGADGAAYTGVQKVEEDKAWYAFTAEGAMRTGAVTTQDGSQYYFDAATGKAVTGWVPKDRTGEAVRYYHPDYAYSVTGPQTIGTEKYLFDDNGLQKTGRYVDSVGSIYLYDGEGGRAVTGPYSPDGGTTNYYFGSGGAALVGLVPTAEGGRLHYFDANGVQQTKLVRLQSGIYYFNVSSGEAEQGLFTDPDTQYMYYFGDDGAAFAGGTFPMEDGRTYVCDPDGHIQSMDATTGYAWAEEDGVWYYRNSAGEYHTGLKKLEDGYWYYFEDGGAAWTTWRTVDGKLYLFGQDRRAVTGWHSEPKKDGETGGINSYYFHTENAYALTGVVTLGEGDAAAEYEFDNNGVLIRGTVPEYNKWKQVGDYWYYYDSTGKLATGLRQVEGKLYFFSAGGERLSGRQTDGKDYYFFAEEDGTAQYGWIPDGGVWYAYSQSSYKQLTGWQERAGDGAATYNHYFDPATGEAHLGFVPMDGVTRYFRGDGSMAVGWEPIGDYRYYFFRDGARAEGVLYVEGVLCSFDGDGRQVNGWNKDKNGLSYHFKDNAAQRGWVQIDERWYVFDTAKATQLIGMQYRDAGEGVSHAFYYDSLGMLPAAVDDWQSVNGLTRYIYADGHMAVGFSVIDGKLYYFSANGQAATGTTVIDGVSYPFAEDGSLEPGWYPEEGGAPRYYFGETGAAKGWTKLPDGVWYLFDAANAVQKTDWQTHTDEAGVKVQHYYDADGISPAGEWTDFGGVHRYFEADGGMAEGWRPVGEGADEYIYYFMPGTGKMATGAVVIDEVQYSFGSDGKIKPGWNEDGDGNRYYFAEDGAVKGWQTIDKRVYRFDDTTGVQLLGWQPRVIGGKTLYYYYFDDGTLPEAGLNDGIDGEERYVLADGQLASGWYTLDGKNLYFDEKGLAAVGWLMVEGRWYCFGTDGSRMTGMQDRPIDGGGTARYFFFDDGTLPPAGFGTSIDGKRRYVSADGELPKGWLTVGGYEYYFAEGGIPTTGLATVDGKTCAFDAEGRYVAPPTISGVSAETGMAITKKVTVAAYADPKAADKTLQYSFDGGKTWQSSNVYDAPAASIIPAGNIRVKDAVGNVSQYTAAAITIDPHMGRMHGIDVSAWQSYINWDSVKANGTVDYVIARSLTWSGSAVNPKTGKATGYYVIDPYFERNVREAKARGIKVGTYLFTYAFNRDEMLEEITFFMNSKEVQGLIRDGINFDLPVFIDVEYNSLIDATGGDTAAGDANRTDILRYGMVLIEQMSRKTGMQYIPGFYMNLNWARNYYHAAALQNEGYDFWLAHWGVANHGWGGKAPTMWQYGTAFVGGIAGGVDANWLYKDFGNRGGTVPQPSAQVYNLTVYDRISGQVVTAPANDILARIVMAEVGGFNNAEVYKAQAVAAQSWLIYNYNVSKVAAPSVDLREPTAQVQSAVNEVAGQYLMYNGAPALTPYYAYSAGTTNDAKYWNSANNLPYLAQVPSAYDTQKGALVRSLSQAEMKALIDKAYGAGTADQYSPSDWIRITSTNAAGYVTGVSVCGHTPTVDVFYQRILEGAVNSPHFTFTYSGGTFTFTSRGWGHCIGMSQNGAYGLAVQSQYNYKQILAHYYPGTVIGKL